MSTSICWELTCDGLVSHPGGVKDSDPLNTTETGDTVRAGCMGHLARKEFSLHSYDKKLLKCSCSFSVILPCFVRCLVYPINLVLPCDTKLFYLQY